MFILDPELQQFATPKQWEKLLAWAKHGSSRKAAAALGISTKTGFTTALKAVRKKAADAGYTPRP